jgi:hypothetical protein
MAVAGLSPDPEPPDQVRAYLAVLATGLTGPGAARTAILAEVEDGLLEAVATRVRRGLPPAAAQAAAIAEFGAPVAVAAGFRTELAAASARRVGLGLLVTGPIVGTTWLAAMASSSLGAGQRPPASLGLVAALFAVALAVGVPAAVCAVAATGRLSRWLPSLPRAAPAAASVAALACAHGDVVLLGWVLASTLLGRGSFGWPLAVVPLAASLLRLVLASTAARRCLAARSRLSAT